VSQHQPRPDVEALRERLEAEARRLESALGRFDRIAEEARDRAGRRDPCALLNASDAAAVEGDPDVRAADRRSEELRRVEEALARLDADPAGFGLCARCGAAIDVDRLMLLPHATRCRSCAATG
jgi:DnaK suppressor protein